jgi:predicted nucleotidyltransferase
MPKKLSGKNAVKAQLASNFTNMRKFGIKRIGIFGSLVRGEEKKDSDIDILVEFEQGHEKFNNLMGLYFYLQEMFGKKVDLVTTGSLSAYLAPFILAEVEYIEAAS